MLRAEILIKDSSMPEGLEQLDIVLGSAATGPFRGLPDLAAKLASHRCLVELRGNFWPAPACSQSENDVNDI
jgi:hypothetical protein